jgi:HEAT repeat protein
MENSFRQSLKHITGDAPLKPSQLYGLSMMGKANLADFEAAWPHIDTSRRQEIMKQLMEITEYSFEVVFDPIFILGLNDSDAEVQTTAIKGLWENESPALVPPLIHLLKEGQTNAVRAAAAIALGQFIYLGELEEMDALAVMLAEQALLETIRRSNEEIEVIRRAIESISYSSQEGVEQIIEDAYYHEDELMQVSAIFAMGRNYNLKWGPIVIAELDNHNPEIRFEAARACGELMLKDAVDWLIRLIEEDPDSEVQQNAIWSLGQIGGQKAQQVLEILTTSTDEAISAAAEEALSELLLMGGDIDDLLNFASEFDAQKDDDFYYDEYDDYEIFNLN